MTLYDKSVLRGKMMNVLNDGDWHDLQSLSLAANIGRSEARVLLHDLVRVDAVDHNVAKNEYRKVKRS